MFQDLRTQSRTIVVHLASGRLLWSKACLEVKKYSAKEWFWLLLVQSKGNVYLYSHTAKLLSFNLKFGKTGNQGSVSIKTLT